MPTSVVTQGRRIATLLRIIAARTRPMFLSALPDTAEGKCCYSGPKDCDSSKDYCSKNKANCDECSGTFYSSDNTTSGGVDKKETPHPVQPVLLSVVASTKTAGGKCCYSGPKDCDSPKDYCSKNKANCDECSGTFYSNDNTTSGDAPEVVDSSVGDGEIQLPVQPMLLSAVANANTAGGKCCYSGPKDCDSPKDYCSKNKANCDECSGTFYSSDNTTSGSVDDKETPQPVQPMLLSDVANTDTAGGKCCYSGPKDCDSPKDYCSKNKANCDECSGTFYSSDNNTTSSGASGTVDKSLSDKETPQLVAPMFLNAVADTAGGKCCYSGPKDCDSPKDYCSKNKANCDECSGTFYNTSSSDASDTSSSGDVDKDAPQVVLPTILNAVVDGAAGSDGMPSKTKDSSDAKFLTAREKDEAARHAARESDEEARYKAREADKEARQEDKEKRAELRHEDEAERREARENDEEARREAREQDKEKRMEEKEEEEKKEEEKKERSDGADEASDDKTSDVPDDTTPVEFLAKVGRKSVDVPRAIPALAGMGLLVATLSLWHVYGRRTVTIPAEALG
eukprot:TRINITY_DN1166_c0_g1_i5.p1 TRINITY_DN1166_c0_g1~~TRINITY_DN1166_c0_g1_i5.p1  ORF type:complete len:568 (-),score=133.97 TRINITY_DN1166_c0_g1_i5:139-1842(-)